MFRQSKYSKRVASFMLGSIAIIFVIITIISVIAFSFVYNSFKKNTINSTKSKLQMLSISTEATLNETKAISNDIAIKDFIQEYKLVDKPLSKEHLYNTFLLINNIDDYTLTFRSADECAVFFNDSESIIYYEYFKYMQDYYAERYSQVYDSYETFKQIIFNSEAPIYQLRAENTNTAKELNAYNVLKDGDNKVEAVIKVKVYTTDLLNQMKNILIDVNGDSQQQGLVAITDRDNQLLLCVGEENLIAHLSQDEYKKFSEAGTRYVSVSIQADNEFRYTYILPNQIFTYELKKLTQVFVTIFLVMVFGISLVGFYLMRRHAKSLQHILGFIDNDDKKSSIYKKIDYKIQTLIEDNALLSNNLNQEKELLLDMFYEKLLSGSYINEKDLLNNMQATGTNICGKLYCVCTLCVDIFNSDSEIDSITTKNLSIKYIAKDIVINELHSHVILNNQMVTVIFVANTSKEIFEKNINLYINKFKSKMVGYNFDYYVCIGKIVENLMQIRKSYSQTQLLRMKYAIPNNKNEVYSIASDDIEKSKIMELNDSLKNQIYMLVLDNCEMQ